MPRTSSPADIRCAAPDVTATVAPLLSSRQRRILDFIRTFHRDHGYAPSMREVAKAVGFGSASAAQYQLRLLKAMGWIQSVPGRPRAIVVRNPADGTDDRAAA